MVCFHLKEKCMSSKEKKKAEPKPCNLFKKRLTPTVLAHPFARLFILVHFLFAVFSAASCAIGVKVLTTIWHYLSAFTYKYTLEPLPFFFIHILNPPTSKLAEFKKGKIVRNPCWVIPQFYLTPIVVHCNPWEPLRSCILHTPIVVPVFLSERIILSETIREKQVHVEFPPRSPFLICYLNKIWSHLINGSIDSDFIFSPIRHSAIIKKYNNADDLPTPFLHPAILEAVKNPFA